MKRITALSCTELARCVDQSLHKLNFAYHKNKTPNVVEFEVLFPCRFRVIVENYTEITSHTLIGLQSRGGSTLGIGSDIENPEPRAIIDKHARVFLQALVETLPHKPWRDLGTLRSRSERKKWVELGFDDGLWKK